MYHARIGKTYVILFLWYSKAVSCVHHRHSSTASCSSCRCSLSIPVLYSVSSSLIITAISLLGCAETCWFGRCKRIVAARLWRRSLPGRHITPGVCGRETRAWKLMTPPERERERGERSREAPRSLSIDWLSRWKFYQNQLVTVYLVQRAHHCLAVTSLGPWARLQRIVMAAALYSCSLSACWLVTTCVILDAHRCLAAHMYTTYS